MDRTSKQDTLCIPPIQSGIQRAGSDPEGRQKDPQDIYIAIRHIYITVPTDNDQGSDRVQMAMLGYHIPPSLGHPRHATMSLHMSEPLLPQWWGKCLSELSYYRSPIIPIPSTLSRLPHIHTSVLQSSLNTIHPP